MAFLEELGKTLTDTGKEVAVKARALTEAIQIKTQLSAERAKLDEAFAEIGKHCCEIHQEPEDEAFAKPYEAVRACKQRIAQLEAELCQVEGSRICAECGAKVPKDSAFCGKCGAAMSAPVMIVPEQVEEVRQEAGCGEAAPCPGDSPQADAQGTESGIGRADEDAFADPKEQ